MRRVAVLGDSMIAAVSTMEDRTAVVRLESLLNAVAPRSRWEVQNFGVSSANTPQELVTYREIARGYHPDVVVVAFNVANDLADNCMCLTRAHRLYFELGPDGRLVERLLTPPAASLGAWLELHSRFYVWQKAAVARLRANLRGWRERLDVGNEVFRADGSTPVEEAWRLTEATLAELKRLVEADGARLMLVLVPAPEEIYDDLWGALQRRAGPDSHRYARTEPQRRLRAIGERLSLRTLDLGPVLCAQASARDSRVTAEQLFFEGRYHWNDRGNETAAVAMAQALTPNSSEDRTDAVVEHR